MQGHRRRRALAPAPSSCCSPPRSSSRCPPAARGASLLLHSSSRPCRRSSTLLLLRPRPRPSLCARAELVAGCGSFAGTARGLQEGDSGGALLPPGSGRCDLSSSATSGRCAGGRQRRAQQEPAESVACVLPQDGIPSCLEPAWRAGLASSPALLSTIPFVGESEDACWDRETVGVRFRRR